MIDVESDAIVDWLIDCDSVVAVVDVGGVRVISEVSG